MTLKHNLYIYIFVQDREQRKRYIELGKYCEECNAESLSDSEDESNKKSDENIVLKENVEPTPAVIKF